MNREEREVIRVRVLRSTGESYRDATTSFWLEEYQRVVLFLLDALEAAERRVRGAEIQAEAYNKALDAMEQRAEDAERQRDDLLERAEDAERELRVRTEQRDEWMVWAETAERERAKLRSQLQRRRSAL